MSTEEDGEVEDIVIEFEGNFDLDSVEGKQLQLIGIDTDEPVLKIDAKFYKIDIKDSIGTRMIFNQNSDGNLEYFAKTDKIVMARRVLLKAK